jgi:hypothetical protein
MSLRLVFDTFDDIRGRCDIAPIRLAGGEPGYDDGALVPSSNWSPLTAGDAEWHRADDTTLHSIRIELLHQSLPDLHAHNLTRRFESAAGRNPLNGRWPPTSWAARPAPPTGPPPRRTPPPGGASALHVDNFDRLPYATRHQSRRRLCLNLGPGPRYLLLGDQDIQ